MINLVDNKNFIEDVNEQANLIIEQIHKEMETYEKDEINVFKASLEKEIDAYYEGELNDLRLKSHTTISQNKLDTKRKLLKLRSDLAKELFDATEAKLLAFSHSKEYETYLYEKLKKHALEYCNGYFEVRQEDVELFKRLSAELNICDDIRVADIRLGGFAFYSMIDKIKLDETLDSQLTEQEAWFMDHSGFIL